jgi:pyridoxal phosphate enzyme (YggS family)
MDAVEQGTSERAAEIAANLAEVRARIESACQASGRNPAEVLLVVVTKTFPASDVAILADLGCTDVAENRDQEAGPKRASVEVELRSGLRWHMIGQLQRNKARSVAEWTDVVESVDRAPLATALSAAAVARGRSLDVMIQVCLDPAPAPGRGGILPEQAPELADHCQSLPGLALVGVMGVAPYPGDPVEAFGRLALVRERIRQAHPSATEMSAGMSGDLEAAIAHGATQVRIGGAVLGKRPPLK